MRAVLLRSAARSILAAQLAVAFCSIESSQAQTNSLLPRFVLPAAQSNNNSDFDNLEFVDHALEKKLGVLRVGSEVGENKLLSVFAGLKNKTSRQLVIELETIYKDKDGNNLNAGSWISMTLQPHEEKEYHSASISTDAVDFLVRVRGSSAAVPSPASSQGSYHGN